MQLGQSFAFNETKILQKNNGKNAKKRKNIEALHILREKRSINKKTDTAGMEGYKGLITL